MTKLRGNHAVITRSGFQNFGCQNWFLIGPIGIVGHSAAPRVDRDSKPGLVSVRTTEIVWENRLKQEHVNSQNVPGQNGHNGVNGLFVPLHVIMEKRVEREHVRKHWMDVPVKVLFEHHRGPHATSWTSKGLYFKTYNKLYLIQESQLSLSLVT